MLILRKPWDSQPQEAVELRAGVFALNPAIRPLSSAPIGVYSDGKSYDFNGSTDVSTEASGPPLLLPWTMLVRVRINAIPASLANIVNFSNDTSSNPTVACGLAINSDGKLRGVTRSSGSSMRSAITANVLAGGETVTAIVSCTPGFLRIWVNGADFASVAFHYTVARPIVVMGGPTAFTSLPGYADVDIGLVAILPYAVSNDSAAREICDAPWDAVFAPRSIWVPVSSSASGTSYTISPSGGITFSGSGTEVHTKVIDVNGGVTFAGTGSMAFATTGTTYTISPSGGITFAGTGVQVRSKTIAPEGGFTFSGSGLDLRTKVIDISGGVTFGGTGSMTSNTSVVTGTVGERTKVGVGT